MKAFIPDSEYYYSAHRRTAGHIVPQPQVIVVSRIFIQFVVVVMNSSYLWREGANAKENDVVNAKIIVVGRDFKPG
jgi:hypothetical protein